MNPDALIEKELFDREACSCDEVYIFPQRSSRCANCEKPLVRPFSKDLNLCQMAERKLIHLDFGDNPVAYFDALSDITDCNIVGWFCTKLWLATPEQRVEAICRVLKK